LGGPFPYTGAAHFHDLPPVRTKDEVKKNTKILILVVAALVLAAVFASTIVGVLVGFLGVIIKFALVLIVAVLVLVGARSWIAKSRRRS
jgi:hypothetical protein